MNDISKFIKDHYVGTFKKYGASSKGVDWGADEDVETRYVKMMEVLNHDYEKPEGIPSLLDVGCGWGGLYHHCNNKKINIKYTGVDLVPEMIEYANETCSNSAFILADILNFDISKKYDYVVGSGLLALRLAQGIVQTEKYAKQIIRKMFELSNYGIAFNLMSNRVNYMDEVLHYTSPSEILNFCLTEISPRVRLDHAYVCLDRKKGKLYEYSVYIYKNK